MALKHSNLDWITSVILGITLCIIGIIGNTISICVWRRFMRKKIGSTQSSSVYFIALAVVDTGLLVFFFLTNSLKDIGDTVQHTYAYNWFYSYIGFPMFFFFIVASIWLVVGLTINRLIVVRFPVKAREHCTNKRAYIAIASILAFCFIINFPHFFNFKPACADPTEVTCTSWTAASTPYTKRGSAIKYEFWVHCMFLVLVPWGSIATLNAWIIVTLMKNTKGFKELYDDEQKLTERQKQDGQITKVLLTVTFAFLILLAWQCVNQCFFMLHYTKDSDPDNWKLVVDTYDFARLGVVLNSSINCFLYCFSGSTFRKELGRMVGVVDESTIASVSPYNTRFRSSGSRPRNTSAKSSDQTESDITPVNT